MLSGESWTHHLRTGPLHCILALHCISALGCMAALCEIPHYVGCVDSPACLYAPPALSRCAVPLFCGCAAICVFAALLCCVTLLDDDVVLGLWTLLGLCIVPGNAPLHCANRCRLPRRCICVTRPLCAALHRAWPGTACLQSTVALCKHTAPLPGTALLPHCFTALHWRCASPGPARHTVPLPL